MNSRLKSTESREKKGIGSSKMKEKNKERKSFVDSTGKGACWTHMTTELCPWEKRKKAWCEPGKVVHIFNLSSQEAEAGGSL